MTPSEATRVRREPSPRSAPGNRPIQPAAGPAGGYCFPDLSYRSALILGNVKIKTRRASAAPAEEGRGGGDDTPGCVLPRSHREKWFQSSRKGLAILALFSWVLGTLLITISGLLRKRSGVIGHFLCHRVICLPPARTAYVRVSQTFIDTPGPLISCLKGSASETY